MSGERMPAVKRKVRYRKAERHEANRCKVCSNRRVVPIYKLGGELHKHDARCAVIGFHNSIKYKVQYDHTCDSFSKE